MFLETYISTNMNERNSVHFNLEIIFFIASWCIPICCPPYYWKAHMARSKVPGFGPAQFINSHETFASFLRHFLADLWTLRKIQQMTLTGHKILRANFDYFLTNKERGETFSHVFLMRRDRFALKAAKPPHLPRVQWLAKKLFYSC